MQTRSYFATSIEGAMEQARNELGLDAFLLKSMRGAKSGLPGYEVTFGIEEPAAATAKPAMPEAKPVVPEPKQAAPETKPVVAEPKPVVDEAKPVVPEPKAVETVPSDAEATRLSTVEYQQLSKQLDEIRAILARTAQAGPKTARSLPELSNLQARLIASGVDPVLSKDVIDRVEASLAVDAISARAEVHARSQTKPRVLVNCDYNTIEQRMREELERRVKIDAQLTGKLAVFVGPTGSGKTTSMVKLAMAVQGRVKLLSLDSSPGAHEEMRLYANMSTRDFVPLGSASKLPKMIQSMKDADLIMLDTPGYIGSDSKEAAELANALTQCPGADVFLVVAGYMKGDDLQRTIARYTKFGFSKMVVTKLDETGGLGSVFSESVRAGKNISFLTDGTRIPHDIRPATADEVINLALAGATQRESHAA